MWLFHGHLVTQARNLGVFLDIFPFLTLRVRHQVPQRHVRCSASLSPLLPALVSLGSTHSHSRFSKTRIWSDFPGGPVGGNPPVSAGDTGSISDLGGCHMPWGN